jgi:GTP cyclohydrolase I
MAGNARSPPDNSTVPSLSNLSLNDTPRQSLGLPRPVIPGRSGSVTKVPRPQREGYGFRPKSGQTTPAETEPSQGPFSPVLKPAKTASRARGEEDDEEDEDDDLKYGYHQPDRISVGDLRQGVKDELNRQGQAESSNLVIQGPGIADAEGLGWPGQSFPGPQIH